jgi:hypothetical protein
MIFDWSKLDTSEEYTHILWCTASAPSEEALLPHILEVFDEFQKLNNCRIVMRRWPRVTQLNNGSYAVVGRFTIKSSELLEACRDKSNDPIPIYGLEPPSNNHTKKEPQ